MRDAYLILENGTVFKGRSFGYDGNAVGELVFTTGMTGYLETLSDPAYYGQIVLQTFPLIGNYGVIQEDFGSGIAHLKAYIVRDWCQEPSNFRSEGNLDSFLREMKIPGLFDIDTRKLTRIIRDNKTMNAMISNTPDLSEQQWAELRGYKVENAVASVCATIDQPTTEQGSDDSGYKAVVLDFGNGSRIAEQLQNRGFSVAVLGFDSSDDEILSLAPDWVVLSGGPGDPAENKKIIDKIKRLCDLDVSIFAVGLGHQMLALANGAKTEKLPFGHRGANQAVKKLGTSTAYVTTQNHGYTVVPESLPNNASMSYVNVNDGTCEGITYNDIKAFSVQFDPTDDVFNTLIEMMGGGCKNAAE